MLTGMFVGGVRGTGLEAARSWLGTSPQMTTIFIEKSTWADWKGEIAFNATAAKAQGVTPLWSVPLIADTANLQDGAAHKYDANYVYAAQKLVAAFGRDQPIIVRLGNEMNESYFNWSAIKDPAAFAQTFRNAVDAFRSVSGNFKFEWNIQVSKTAMDSATAYPGDKYVDFIGGDFYFNKPAATAADGAAMFQYLVTSKYGLQWVEDFAAAHGKQSAYSEWGMNTANGGSFIALAKQWFDTHDVAYANYWDSNADFRGKLSNGQYGAAGEVYKAMLVTGVDPAGSYTARSWTGDGANNYFGQEATNINYTLDAGSGNDVIALGHGNNSVSGGYGSDIIYVGNGDNLIYGNAAGVPLKDGNDTIMAGSGSNRIDGQSGDDRITVGAAGSAGKNVIDGGDGNDSIVIKGAGANSAQGGAGADRIDAGAATGGNLLAGGLGNDTLQGGAGRDTLTGGDGDDRLVAGRGSGHADLLTGGGGADVFDFSQSGSGAVASAGTLFQEVTDFLHGTDHIDLALRVGTGDLLVSTKLFTTVASAQGYAQQLLDGHAGTTDIAALKVGADSFLFYQGAGAAGSIDSILKLDTVAPTALTYQDFI